MATLRQAFRQLIKTPGFTVIAVITLALGIGLNTAMFSVVNAFLLRPLPFREAHQLFRVFRTTPQNDKASHAPAIAFELKRNTAEFADLAIYRNWGFTISDPGQPAAALNALRVTSNFFDVLGVQPALGRAFREEEDRPGENRVIILSHSIWKERYGADPAVIGRIIRLDGVPTEIVGVMPPSLKTSGLYGFVQVLRPLGLSTEELASLTDTSLGIIGRYRAGITSGQGKARFAAEGAKISLANARLYADSGLNAVSLQSTRVGDNAKKLTYMLLGLSGFVLLIACANLANLLLARAITRVREYAIRAALGASRLQTIGPLAAECALLAALGGALGSLVALGTTQWMADRFGRGDPSNFPLAMDVRVLAFACFASLLTALFFGLAPAMLLSRVPVNDNLKANGRGMTGNRSHHRFRSGLVALQFSLALVVLTGTTLFALGINRLLQTHEGYEPAALVTCKVTLPSDRVRDAEGMLTFYQQVRDRFAALPGVVNACVSLDIPIFGFDGPRTYALAGQESAGPSAEIRAFTNAVDPHYLDVVQTKLLKGRNFTEQDKRLSPGVVLINESMARAFFPNGDAVGRQIAAVGSPQPSRAEIVGIVNDVTFPSIAAATTPFHVYKPLAQETWGYVAFTIRAESSAVAASLIETMRKTMTTFDPDIPLLGLCTAELAVKQLFGDITVINQLLFAFAGLGLLLSAIGIYGVISRLVTQRTNEIGIRIALGAEVIDVVKLVLASGMAMVGVGIALGVLGSFVLTRVLSQSMPGLSAGGALAIAVAAGILGLVALLACWLPARRAGRVDPVIALRSE